MNEKTNLGQKIQKGLRLGRALRLVWKSAPGWTLVNSILVVVQGLLPLTALYLLKRIIDAVTAGFSAPDKTAAFQAALFWITLAGAVALFSVLARSLSELTGQAQSLVVTDKVSDILHAQSIVMDLEYYEDSRYYNTLHRAQQEAPSRPTRIVNGLVQIGQNSISLLGIAGLLFAFNWLLALVIFAVALPGALVRIVYARRLYGFEQKQTENERRAWYYHWMMTGSAHAKEIRMFNLGNLFQERFRKLRQQLREGRLSLSRRRTFSDFLTQTLTTAAIFGTLAFISFQTIRGAITVGSLVMYYSAFQAGVGFLQGILRGMTGLYEDNLFLANFYQFLALDPKIQAPSRPRSVPQKIEQGIAFQDVHFQYPGEPQEVLQGIDLTIAPGQVIALVGENGSGKTTLIKLLCRLYDPAQGKITIDGINLSHLDPICWRRELSVIFQDYIQYHLSVWENIWLGNVETQPNREQITQAARLSGADPIIRRLPEGYDTQLGHWFQKGHELSIGEWQKVALARAFLRDSRFVVLDEPTSSLDPLAEAELFQQFRKLIQGRSAILISHRFSTVQMADYIYVLNQGRIIERGSHQELLTQNGFYARLFRAQAEHYQENSSNLNRKDRGK
jgi:ATP-binding cassette subfamily B protein